MKQPTVTVDELLTLIGSQRVEIYALEKQVRALVAKVEEGAKEEAKLGEKL